MTYAFILLTIISGPGSYTDTEASSIDRALSRSDCQALLAASHQDVQRLPSAITITTKFTCQPE